MELLSETTVSGTATATVDVTGLSQNYHTLKVIVHVPYSSASATNRRVGIHPIMSDGRIINGSGTYSAFDNNPILIASNADTGTMNNGLNVGNSDSSGASWGNFAVHNFHMYSINAQNGGTANTVVRLLTGFGSSGTDQWTGVRTFIPRTNTLTTPSPANVTITGIRLAIIDNWTTPLPANTKMLIYGVGSLAV